MAMGAMAGACFALFRVAEAEWRIAALVAGAAFCQLRLLCNLFDGMIAVEGGRPEDDGAFWNEFPDRVSDILIFSGLGYGVGALAPGLLAALLAVMTAYVRELGRAAGQEADFSGPMAKQHRMAAVFAGVAGALAAMPWHAEVTVLRATLGVVIAGALLTIFRRARKVVKRMKSSPGI